VAKFGDDWPSDLGRLGGEKKKDLNYSNKTEWLAAGLAVGGHKNCTL